MDSEQIINDAFKVGKISRREALDKLEKRFPDTIWVLCKDTGIFEDSESCYLSEPSDTWYSSDSSFVTVNRSRRRADISCHEDDAESIAFRCQSQCEWYHNDDFTEVEINNQFVCLEANEDDIYYWDSDGEYHWDPEPEEDEDDNGRGEYHGASSDRRKWSSMQGMGVELEIKCEDDMQGFCEALNQKGLLTEKDASLDDETGVEIIGAPYSLADYASDKTGWKKAFALFPSHDCKGHDAGTGYGMHVSLSLSLFSGLQLAKFVVLLNTCASLCKCIAQRENIYSGGYKIQTKLKNFKEKKTSKYEACKVDENRAEVRIFRSTLRKDRFLKNLEFCEAVRLFVNTQTAAMMTQEMEAEKAFLNWLEGERKNFPNLASFLAEKGKLKVRKEPPLKLVEGTPFVAPFTDEKVV